MIEEFNMDWKAECGQLNVAHETKTNNGRARVTADEERVLHVDWTEIRLCRYYLVKLASCESFVGEWEEFIFNAFISLHEYL